MAVATQDTRLIIHSDIAARWEEEYPNPTWKGTLGEAGINPWGDKKAEEVLEDIFRAFNRVTEEDCQRLDVIGYELPSLSVNDSVIVGDRFFSVERVGFVEREIAQVG